MELIQNYNFPNRLLFEKAQHQYFMVAGRQLVSIIHPLISATLCPLSPVNPTTSWNPVTQHGIFSISLLEREICFIRNLASSSKTSLPILPAPYRTLIDGNYEVLQYIASGAYGNVYKAKEWKRSRLCAIKVIKSKHSSKRCVKREAMLLNFINQLGPANTRFIVQLYRAFISHNHLFMVYELLGPSLCSVMRYNNRTGFPLQIVKEIGIQLVSATIFLHSLGFVHHDIKPDNIVFACYDSFYIDEETGRKFPRNTTTKLVDFGSTLHVTDMKSNVPTTRQYRSPEMGMNYEWTFASDMWSVGCTLFELITGIMIFACENEPQKCYMIEHVLKQSIPLQMGKSSQLDCFDNLGKLKYDENTLLYKFHHLKTYNAMTYETSSTHLHPIFHLIENMLRVEPSERISSENAFQHLTWSIDGSTDLLGNDDRGRKSSLLR